MIPNAHKYWMKKPKAFHWGPSQKSVSIPGSSGIGTPSALTYAPGSSTAAPSPTSPTTSSCSSSGETTAPFLPFSSLRVRDEMPLLACVIWELLPRERLALAGEREEDKKGLELYWRRGYIVLRVMVEVRSAIGGIARVFVFWWWCGGVQGRGRR